MPATIRLKRVGRKKQSAFRIVVAEKSTSVDGPAIEKLGIYQPRTDPSVVQLDAVRTLHWLRDGATPTDTVRSLFRRAGVWEKYHDGVTPEDLGPDEKSVILGPPVGGRKTSRRADAAAEAEQEAEAAAEEEDLDSVEQAEAEAAAALEAEDEGEDPAATAESAVADEEGPTEDAAVAVEEAEEEAEEADEEDEGDEAEEPVAEADEVQEDASEQEVEDDEEVDEEKEES